MKFYFGRDLIPKNSFITKDGIEVDILIWNQSEISSLVMSLWFSAHDSISSIVSVLGLCLLCTDGEPIRCVLCAPLILGLWVRFIKSLTQYTGASFK